MPDLLMSRRDNCTTEIRKATTCDASGPSAFMPPSIAACNSGVKVHVWAAPGMRGARWVLYHSRAAAQERKAAMSTIGTLHEGPLHAALKARYAQSGAAVEVELHGYVVDVVAADCWIEIQTGHVAQIKRKMACLVEQHPVRLVLPVTLEKWLVRVEPDGVTVLGRRKSPQRGAIELIFRELVSIPHLLAHPNFSLAALLIREEEVRRHDPTHNWRRHGWGTIERRLLAVVAEHVFVTPADLAGLLPLTLAESFTADRKSVV